MIVYSSRTTQDPLDRFMAAYADMDADKVDVDHSGSYEFLHLEGLERAKAFMEKFIKFGDQFSSPDDDFSSPFLSLKFWSVIFFQWWMAVFVQAKFPCTQNAKLLMGQAVPR